MFSNILIFSILIPIGYILAFVVTLFIVQFKIGCLVNLSNFCSVKNIGEFGELVLLMFPITTFISSLIVYFKRKNKTSILFPLATLIISIILVVVFELIIAPVMISFN